MGIPHDKDESVGELQSNLASNIQGKSFFLVLDDVWHSEAWEDLLRTPLHAAATGVVLVTTRDDTIARVIGVDHTHRVNLMSADVGWELLWRSMNIKEEKQVQNLKDVGIEIVSKCGGLPLVIRVVAKVLATHDQTENEWRKMLGNSAWSMSKLPHELRGALYLSYDALPHQLKQCFLSCALYPEDAIIHRDFLIWMWVAEGFIEKQEDQLLEDTAEKYYYELIHRNLLQPDGSYIDHVTCKMHDLLRQLACYLSREECFVGDPESIGSDSMCKVRRISVVTEKDMVVLPSVDKDQYKVRCFTNYLYGTSQRIDDSLFKRLVCLRVLDLSDSLLHNIPGEIGYLIHLRLLDLTRTDISSLPESIGSLQNLQILNLLECESLHSLPLATTQLCNIRRLGLQDTPINNVPKGIGRLKFLNDLVGFPVSHGSDNTKMQDGWNLEELAHLSQLRRLGLSNLEKATPGSSTDSLLLIDKVHLKDLILSCTEPADEEYSEEGVSNVEKIFDQLTPPHNVQEVNIIEYFGKPLPIWIGTAHLPSLELLILVGCKSCDHLPPIGRIPNLKYLRIEGATSITKIGPEFVGYGEDNLRSRDAVAFPKLEVLIIRDMPNWEEWAFIEEEVEEEEEADAAAEEGGEDGATSKQKGKEVLSPRSSWLLPCLKKFDIVNCPKLTALPPQLGQQATSLKLLIIGYAGCLKRVENLWFLSDALQIEECESLERVSNIPHVRKLYVTSCPNLRCVEELGSLEQLWLMEDMQEISLLWVPGLQEQHRQHHEDELEVIEWFGWPY